MHRPVPHNEKLPSLKSFWHPFGETLHTGKLFIVQMGKPRSSEGKESAMVLQQAGNGNDAIVQLLDEDAINNDGRGGIMVWQGRKEVVGKRVGQCVRS